MRAHTILTLHKIIKEGLVDQLLALNYFTADVQKMVEKLGPSLGTTARGQLLYRVMAMALTGVYRANGVSVFPEIVRMFDPYDKDFFLFRDDIYQDRHNTLFKVNPRNRLDIRTLGLEIIDESTDPWVYDPMSRPDQGTPWMLRNEETGREMSLDPRMDPMFLAQYYIYIMGWEDPGKQQHFNQLARFKLHFGNSFRRIATEQVIARVRVTYQTPGAVSETFFKDIKAALDPTGKEQGGVFPTGIFTSKVDLKSLSGSVHFDKVFWEDLYCFLLDAASEMWEEEAKRDAANNLLTFATVYKAASASGWQWNHLTVAGKKAKMLRIWRILYAMIELVDVNPAFGSETFYRAAASKLIAEGLYLHLPEPEKSQKKGRLQVMADYCQMVLWAKCTVLNNAREANAHGLVEKGFGFYPPGFMNLELVDRIHEIITRFYEHDKVAVDKVLKQIARRLTVSHTGGLGINKDDRSDIHAIILTAIGMGCGIEGLVDELHNIGFELVIDPEDEKKMMAVEFTWRCDRLKELVELEEIWRLCGIDVEKENVSLTALWLRLIMANDSGILKRIRAAAGGKEEDSWKAQLFHTAVSAWFEKNRSELVKEALL